MNVIIAGIHTGIGKTICSAVICRALGYDYFKPVQAGELDSTDSMMLSKINSHPATVVHPEIYKLKLAASPHYAAELEGIEIKKENIVLPSTKNNLLVETAGGLMSPLATNFLNIDLISHLGLPVILVSNNYLGSINHTLMSYELLKSRNSTILGIVFNGPENKASESFILQYSKLRLLFSIPQFETLNASAINEYVKITKIDF